MKNVLIPPAKNVLLPLTVTAATSATDAAILWMNSYENLWIRSSCTDNFKRINKRLQKIVKALEELCLLTEGFTKTIKN